MFYKEKGILLAMLVVMEKIKFLLQIPVIFFLSLSLTNQLQAGDLYREWESRIANKLVKDTYLGEPVWLGQGQQQFLGLLAPFRTDESRGAVILLHNLGTHPDWPDVISPLRIGLPEQGWTTLSIQMPMLRPEVPVENYGRFTKLANERLLAAIKYLREQNIFNIVIVGHGLGASYASQYLADNKDTGVFAFVGISMQAHDFLSPSIPLVKNLKKITIPVLDIYAEKDLLPVLQQAPDRRLSQQFSKNEQYTQLEIKSAAPHFRNNEASLVKRIRGWMEKVAPGVKIIGSTLN